jgi:hypothetical protein
MTTPPAAPEPVARTPRLVAALVCCTVATLVVTALSLGLLTGALAWLGSGGPATDRAMATLLAGIAVVLLLPPTVVMWVALVRLATRPPRGATALLACLRTVGGFLLVVALPTVSRGGIGASAAVVGIALAFVGAAQLLATALPREPRGQGL